MVDDVLPSRKLNKKRRALQSEDEEPVANNLSQKQHDSSQNRQVPETSIKTNKGKKKVKKTRMYMDAKGYLVNEEYESEEEVDLPVKKEPEIK